MPIYADYDDEPNDIFLPLGEKRYSDFYALEMDGFTGDLPFFARHLPEQGRILELGCGTGRVGRALAHRQRQVTGIDISLPMLSKAASQGNGYCRYAGMDMRRLAFTIYFDAIIIPYNTLNLLPASIPEAAACLAGCRSRLIDRGRLLLQLYIPHRPPREQAEQKTTFQFQIFKQADGGRVIKEILRTYDAPTETVQIEERYRIRPVREDRGNEDLSHTMDLCAWQADLWCSLLEESGFSIDQRYGGYDYSPFLPGLSSCLLLAAHAR